MTVTSEAGHKRRCHLCLVCWNTCVWNSDLASKKSNYCKAVMLWRSQAKWKGHVWARWLVSSLVFLDIPALIPRVSGASRRFQFSALLSHPQSLGLSSWGPRNQGAVIPSVCCPNSWPIESVNIIKWLFEAAAFWGNLFYNNINSNRNT